MLAWVLFETGELPSALLDITSQLLRLLPHQGRPTARSRHHAQVTSPLLGERSGCKPGLSLIHI